MTAKEAESILLKAGFVIDSQKGSHKIYKREKIRIVIPHHSGKDSHPKIVKEIKIILESLSQS